MNRIFHARITWYQYLALALFTVNAVAALWCKFIIVAVFLLLFLIVLIEQIIHTTYTFTSDGKLEISLGRFSKKKVIPISEVTSVEKRHSMKFGRFSVTHYILIGYGKEQFQAVLPVKEREFVEVMKKRKMELIESPENK